MEAKELRIGNWAHSKYTNTDFQFTSENIYALDNYGDENLDIPIPLTEVWLLKFGFTYEHWRVDETKKYYAYNAFDVFIWDETIILSGYNWRVDIQYVH